ncbi:GGDEF domain-containing protein [Bacterioplanes sanyensis]|uniref:diguanylate cyclase n=1 Tax=Bacterioplanes sanyensis TaxID=1249553 RepID=A0A222FNQ4_9GAMM|nr:GGDEF domain-containing protein [Bacterioplanes sanyensis]ASP40144.1 GGDEF domain-containing protein [Bacterioplanes sanyensis]
MLDTLAHHRRKLALIFTLLWGALMANLWLGEAKPWHDIDWLDVVGEGGSAIALAVWMLLILGSRPLGRVTDLLTLGLGFMFLAMWQDAVDEFLYLPAEAFWNPLLESVAMPFGIGLLTYGLFHWHREQLAINRQLRGREQVFREHRWLDPLTHIGRADYLKQQIITLSEQQPLVLMMLDLNGFAPFNRRFGHRCGDRLLREVTEVLLLNLRHTDLLCRYAGDRFAILLPFTEQLEARRIGEELRQAIAHFAFKTDDGHSHFQSLRIGMVYCHHERSAEQLITAANQALQLDQPRAKVA